MTIRRQLDDKTLTLELEGRLDTLTAPQLEEELKQTDGEVTKLILDLKQLEYISSAGLRVLLAAQKKMNVQGEMIVKDPCDTVREVFDITGFSDILTIEP